MIININWISFGVIITVCIHIFATIWWASRISTLIETLAKEISRFNNELEKRDEKINTMWKRIDQVRDMISNK